MRISATGDDGFSMVEVLVTIAVIGACYVVIAKSLIENTKINRTIDQYSKAVLAARQYFSDPKEEERKNVRISEESGDQGFTIRTFQYLDDKDNKIAEFKEYSVETVK